MTAIMTAVMTAVMVPVRTAGRTARRGGLLASPATATAVGLAAARWSRWSGRPGWGGAAVITTRCDLRDGHERTERTEGEVDEVRGQFHTGLRTSAGVRSVTGVDKCERCGRQKREIGAAQRAGYEVRVMSGTTRTQRSWYLVWTVD